MLISSLCTLFDIDFNHKRKRFFGVFSGALINARFDRVLGFESLAPRSPPSPRIFSLTLCQSLYWVRFDRNPNVPSRSILHAAKSNNSCSTFQFRVRSVGLSFHRFQRNYIVTVQLHRNSPVSVTADCL